MSPQDQFLYDEAYQDRLADERAARRTKAEAVPPEEEAAFQVWLNQGREVAQ